MSDDCPNCAALRAERDNAIAALDANWVQHQAIVASRERAERAEAECADLRRRLVEHIDDKERALRLAAKESNRLTTECAKLRAEFRNLAAILRVNILRLESKATHADIDAIIDAARAGK